MPRPDRRRCATRGSSRRRAWRARSPCPATSAARTGAGVAADAARKIAVVPVNRVAADRAALPRRGFDGTLRREDAARGLTDWEYARMQGTPYVMRRRFSGPRGLPVHAAAVRGPGRGRAWRPGRSLWDVPLGTTPALKDGAPPAPPARARPTSAARSSTASGLVFIGGRRSIAPSAPSTSRPAASCGRRRCPRARARRR